MEITSGLDGEPQLPLREWACVHAELEWIYDQEVAPQYRDWTSRGQRRGYWAWYVRSGQARVVTGDGVVSQAEAGMWLFPPNEPLRQVFAPGTRILSVHFACQWPSGENMLAEGGGLVVSGARFPQLLRRAEQLERVVRRHFPEPDTRYYSRFADYEHFLEFQALFLRWLAVWLKARKVLGAQAGRMAGGDDRVLRAVRTLNNAALNAGFPKADLESETGLGEAHLGRLFFAEYAVSPRKYWEHRRLRHARASLETSSAPVKEIAYSLGFRSDAHFVVWFRDRVGQRPKEYRVMHREKDDS
jgi:AraC-like DNA-binding protein